MSGMWGNKIKISIFGESHGNAIGINIDGLEPGFEIDLDKVSAEMLFQTSVFRFRTTESHCLILMPLLFWNPPSACRG